MMEKSDQRAFEDLQKLLKSLVKNIKPEEKDRMYVYLLPSVLCGLIVPAEVEEAIKVCSMLPLFVAVFCAVFINENWK